MKLHLPHLLRRAVVRALFAAAAVVTTLASSTYADMITPDGRTATQVIQSGNVYDVYTGTVRGNTGFNSFSTFDVYANTTANLHLADGTGRLINVVRDSASHIDGVLNSYKNGRIGGDVYFLNPNGIFVGKSGVINVGSISMSTPTAAFVEQLIARDGSISPTATQAVLAGDMPINEKGTISIKGKVNARNSVEMRAGKVEVKGGEINTGVKFREMVNTGKRKVDTKGMSIQDGRLSFGKKPAKARRAVAKAKKQQTEKKTEIAIFADDVLVDGGALNADWVYIDPDKLEFSNIAISGDYTLEARIIVLNNISVKQGEKLTSFTLNAANELADGTFEGNVSITLSNSNIIADEVTICATATTNAAEAAITISNSTVQNSTAGSALYICATSDSGNASVDIQNSSLISAGSLDVTAAGVKGNASLTLGAASSAIADSVTLAAAAVTGDATVNVPGKVSAGNAASISANTGIVYSDSPEDAPIQEMEFKAAGGGNASVTVDGTVEAKGALSLTASALGTYGDAKVTVNGQLNSQYTETKPVGELALERTPEETVLETDTEDQVNAKNQAYLERYAKYLKDKETDTAAVGTIELAATSSAGNASISQAAVSTMQSNLSANINAKAAKAASVLLAGKVASGDIVSTAQGETASLRVAEGATLTSSPHQVFVQDGTEIFVEKSDGTIALEAVAPKKEDQPAPVDQAPQKQEGVLLEVAGSLIARRETKDGAGEGGTISLVSEGKMLVGGKAVLDASSANGEGGLIYLEAPEYELLAPLANYKVDGTSGKGSIYLANYLELTGNNINDADDISRNFIRETLHLTETSNDIPSEWKGSYIFASLSGNIKLNKDLNVSVATIAIKDNTQISGDGNKYSLTITNSFLHLVFPTSILRIGNDVHITDVKNFTFKFGKTSIINATAGFYVFTPTSLTVGSGFKVHAAENVTMSMEGMGNTYITFGKEVDIKAGKDILISAKNKDGWGGTLGNNIPMDVFSLVKNIPGAEGTPASELLSNLGFIKFDVAKFVIKGYKHLIGEEYDNQVLPQIGVRVSKASVTFADQQAGKIEGGSVTISSSSNADVSGRQNATIGGSLPLALSIGYIYNNSKVDLGKDLVINATGFKTVKDAAGEEHKESVSITSTTTSKVSLQNVFDCNTPNWAVGVLVSVGTDFNTVNIDGSVSITGEHDINIGAGSDIEAEPFMSLGSGWERQVDPPVLNDADDPDPDDDEPGAYANKIIMIGANFLKHKSETTISGTLVSRQGNISMKSEDEISSSLTMNGSIRYSLKKKGEDPKKFPGFWQELARDCFSFDLGVYRYKIREEGKWLVDLRGLKNYFETPEKFLTDLQDVADKGDFFDFVIATDIVLTDNKLYFNGKANAANGTVTINAESEIEAACGAETSIAGVRAEMALAAAISVPVICGNTTVEIGGEANIDASQGIDISSSTELPMSFDIVNWRNWSEFAKNKGVFGNIAQAVKSLRSSLKFLYDYQDNGDFGVLDSLTSSHASTLMRKTGTGEGGDKTIGGNLVVDVRNLNTRTIINDGAKLKAGNGAIEVNSSAKGTQVTVAGQLPIFMTLSNPLYISKNKAASGFGGSIIVGEKTFNTATYIGAATLEAQQLNVDATGDVFMMEMSIGGTFGSEDKGVQGGLNIIAENKMTVSEISGNAQITLSGNGDAEASSITATDKSTLLNISGLQADGGHTAIGFGATITLNNAFTAAMLGNNTPIDSSFQKNWESLKSTYNMPFAREGAITLNLQGSAKLDVLAENKGTLLNIGIAGAVQTSSEEGGTADTAANVGVSHTRSETTARQTGVTKIGSYNNTVTTKAKEHTNIISVAGDASINVAGKNVVTGAGALSVNRGVMDTTAYVTDCIYDTIGNFTVATENTSKVVAVDVAAGVGAATAGLAAGSAWNSLTGNTGSYLTGGRISATNLSVTSLTDLTSFSCTLGAAIGITINAGGQGAEELDDASYEVLKEALKRNEADQNENSWINDLFIGDNDISDDGEGLAIGEDLPELLDDNGVSFDLGASIARNALTMSSTAKVEGCTITTPGELKVTAEDNSVITAVSVGAAVDHADGTTIGAGGVFSFAPVSSTTEAAIKQKAGVTDKLRIQADSLTLHAEDKHRERVWSFGGGYGDTVGGGMVLSWGSFAGASTTALIQNVQATLAPHGIARSGSTVDIKAYSDLSSTFISVGGSGSKGRASATGMINYLNFNNQVITDIKDSVLTVSDINGYMVQQCGFLGTCVTA